jgi:hypothetical protein
VEDAPDIGLHLVIGEANDPVASLFQPGGSGLVVGLMLPLGMVLPIDFYYQPVFVASRNRR